MKILVIIATLFCLVSCSNQTASTKRYAEETEYPVINPDLNETGYLTSYIPETPFSTPSIKMFGVYGAIRNSDKENEHGQQMPPFRELEIYNIFWNIKPKKGEKVTVIPLDTKFAPFELAIHLVTDAKDEYASNCGIGDQEKFWKIELEKFYDKEFLEMPPTNPNNAEEYPFEAFVIYPAIKFARQLDAKNIRKNSLPNGAKISEVTAAIDVTNNGLPDLIELRYCCERAKSREDPTCDYSDCGQLWRKTGKKWKQTDSWSPC